MTATLLDISSAELNAELQRRTLIKNGAWPREIRANFEATDLDSDLDGFLTDICGFARNDNEYRRVMNQLSSITVSVSVESDGSVALLNVSEDLLEQSF